MSHGEKRTVWWKESCITVFTGSLYGLTNTIVGHPFDSIKTKMQAENAYMGKGKAGPGMMATFTRVVQSEGPVALYNGWTSACIGSVFYRGVAFTVFETFFSMWEHDSTMRKTIPFTAGMEYRTILAGWLSGASRAVLETPFEYIKVKRQTGQSWNPRSLFRGLSTVLPRSTFLMGGYFAQMDAWRRHSNLMNFTAGRFFASGSAAVLVFWAIWPLEVLKNLAQAETTGSGSTNLERAQWVLRHNGLAGFYRGLLPGTLSIFLRNGAAGLALMWANQKVTAWGLRDS
uniref:Mitochondrial carrier protein n=1 Tax=Heterosigma akashiwo TaxID=2829 RepID=A0A6V1XCR7_HETAK|mmetsp:Transcript_714/g.1029  ORF Transcript_714/g.1029 Transcript_714/m.1029 type:complete len:287 (+) Transcript_714:276-1136(+)